MLRAELLKLTTTSSAKIALIVGALGLIVTQLVFVTLIPALASGAIGPGPEELGELPSLDLATAADQLAALNPLGAAAGGGSVGIAAIAVVLMGVLAGTADYRFGGIAAAALAQPNRLRLLGSKAGAAGVAGLAFGVVFAVASCVALFGTLVVTGTAVAVEPVAVLAVVARGILAIGCLAVIGLAVGMLARSQLAGVLAMLAILVLEPIVQAVAQLLTGGLPFWAHLLPLSLANAVIGAGPAAGAGGGGVPLGVAAIALVALTGIALALAAVAFRRRDI